MKQWATKYTVGRQMKAPYPRLWVLAEKDAYRWPLSIHDLP